MSALPYWMRQAFALLSCGSELGYARLMLAAWNPTQPEITDLIVRYDPRTLQRLPVRKEEVLRVFSESCNRVACRAVEKLPERAGILDEQYIDRLLIMTHWEMQRLAEEFYHGHRVWDLLRRVVATIRASGFAETIRIIDVGCGTGYSARWLAAHVPLAEYRIELLGMDLNLALIREAKRLAAVEGLKCRFFHGDAFSSEHAGHIFISTGVIHHFRGDALGDFFRRHEHAEAFGFLHYDFQPSMLAPAGSWFFHYLRMRTEIARHDGVLSAARAHQGSTLVSASRAALPGCASGIYGARIWNTQFPRVFHTLVGLRRPLLDDFRRKLGLRVGRLGEIG